MALTSEQRKLWTSDGTPKLGLHVVSARAGTGKTTILTQYCFDVSNMWAQLGFQEWQGMAILSYTNIAKSELEQKIRRERKGFNVIEAPNTIQTLDSFLNDRVFLPYGSNVMKSQISRPALVGEPHRPLTLKDESTHIATRNPKLFTIGAIRPAYYFDKIAYNLVGSILPMFGSLVNNQNKWRIIDTRGGDTYVIDWTLKDGSPSQAQKAMIAYKKKLNTEGLASQSDANYFALVALKKSKRLTRSLIRRFPVVIVDEAQDMTEIQHAILDHLVENGLKNIVIVGDDHQAIYEWNTARPELFITKYSAQGTPWTPHEITHTFRNSRNICYALNSLDGVTAIRPSDKAKSITRDYSDPVYIVDWKFSPRDAATLRGILDNCAKVISEKHYAHDDQEKSLAVIMRSSKDVELLREMFAGKTATDRQPLQFTNLESKDMLKFLYALKHGSRGEVIKRYEKLLMTLHKQETLADLRQLIVSQVKIKHDDEYFSYRKALNEDVTRLIKHLKTAKGKISAVANIDGLTLTCMPTASALDNIKSDYSNVKYSALGLDEIFMDKANRLPEYHPTCTDVKLVFSTAHGVKGETYDGVLFIQKHTGNNCKCDPPQKQPIETADHPLDCEEKRIQYVAMSRAAQTLWLAADPNSYSGKASDAERWKDKTKGELASFQSLSFGRLQRQKCTELKYADADLSKALLASEFCLDGTKLVIFMPTGKKMRQCIIDNEDTIKTFISIHLPQVATIEISRG